MFVKSLNGKIQLIEALLFKHLIIEFMVSVYTIMKSSRAVLKL